MDRADYLKWSAEQLAAIMRDESARRNWMRTQATASFIALPGLLFLALRYSTPLDKWQKLFFLVAGLSSSGALWHWYKLLDVRLRASFTSKVFMEDEQTTAHEDHEARLTRVRDYLVKAVDCAQEERTELANIRGWSLALSAITIVIVGLIYFVRIFRS